MTKIVTAACSTLALMFVAGWALADSATTQPVRDDVEAFAIYLVSDGTTDEPTREFDNRLTDGSTERLRVFSHVYLDRGDVESVGMQDNAYSSGGYDLTLALNAQGSEKMSRLTAANIGHRVAMVSDGKVLLAPRINARISSAVVITQMNCFTKAEAEKFAARIKPRSSGSTTTTRPSSN